MVNVAVWGGELCEAAKVKVKVTDEVAGIDVGLLALAAIGTKVGSDVAWPVEMVMAVLAALATTNVIVPPDPAYRLAEQVAVVGVTSLQLEPGVETVADVMLSGS
jgi:hypothetical protein